MDFKQIVSSRYATKEFDGKKVPQEKIDELLDLIRLSASSYGLQPWKIKVITDAKVKESLAPAAYNQKQITTCSHLLVFCTRTDNEQIVKDWAKMLADNGVPAETVSVMVGHAQGSYSRLNAEQALAWNQKQVYLALGNALNGAKSLGLDSCPMEGFDPAGFAKILKLPANLVPTVLVPVGYPADKPHPKMRYSLKQILA
jgi:nitroreductase